MFSTMSKGRAERRARSRAGWLSAGLVLGLTSLVALGPGPAAGRNFTPHKAIYDVRLDRSRGGEGGVQQASGKMEFEWTDVCRGWTISQRARIRLISGDGRVIEFGWTFNALEEKDGDYYRFFIRRFGTLQPDEELQGEARLKGPGQGGTAVFTAPETKEVPLPKGTLFPTAHSLELMDHAAQGEMTFWRMVFDGSGDDGLFGVNVTVSGSVGADEDLRFKSPLLEGQESWRLQLAFFGADETEAAPEHEQTMRLFQNGVADDMILDYGDFALLARLESLSELPLPPC